MSDLTGIEKQKFEKLLGMSGGYVLDFSNRSFAGFISDSTGRAIYDSRYERDGTSKANRLREFWRQEENDLVGKLMGDMLEYGAEGGLFTEKEALLENCQKVVMRLKGIQAPVAPPQAPAKDERSVQIQMRSEALGRLKNDFFQLHAEADRNKAGFDLEKLVHNLFDLFALKPRQSYRVIGEQIDGSFELDGNVYLLESKAEKDALPEADLLVFKGKIEGKSTFTRGVFIALNDISSPARDAITRGKAPSFFVMNGHDLLMILSEAVTLTDFLRHRIRLLGDKGRVCVPFAEVEKEIAMHKKEPISVSD
jgi:hypothetical protein